jgi:hypothetical protein
MLTRIGDFINPAQSKGEAAERVTEHPDHKNRKKDQQKDDAPAEQNDDTFFSIDAIRALLKQENVALGDDVIASLALLQQHGVISIPIRNEQSIIAAITDAAARLR